MERQQLVGTWSLIEASGIASGGSMLYPWDKEPQGQLIYTIEGFMSVFIMRRERALFTDEHPLRGTDQEQAEAARSMLAYYGRYTLQENKVIHSIENALFPNWSHSQQVRTIASLTAEKLTLLADPVDWQGKIYLVSLHWKRAR